MEQLAGRVVVITGGAGGLGLGMAEAFARDGMRLVLADVDAGALASAVLRFGHAEVVVEPTDVREPAALERLASKALATFGRVDVVVNNAGVGTLGSQWETSLDEWRRVFDVNLMGVVNGMRTFLPLLLDNSDGGHVVNTASMDGLSGSCFTGPYGASKHAVVGLSKGLRAELAALGADVGVTVVCPGSVRTGFVAGVDQQRNGAAGPRRPEVQAVLDTMRADEGSAMDPFAAGRIIRDAVVEGRFWAIPNGGPHLPRVEREVDDLLGELRKA